MLAYVRRIMDDAGYFDGEDVIQEVMLRLLDIDDLTVPVEKYGAYVYRALKNRVIDVLRGKRDTESMDREIPSGRGMTVAGILGDLRYEAAEEFEKAEIRERLFEAIDALSPDQKEILCVTEFEGRSFREVALEKHVPLGTLLARKSRAMANLRKSMSGFFQLQQEE